MNQKIEWYKEVLELEPGSKVFFPLARMQAEDGQTESALATLRHGLARNPEHLEARLLLIDLLFNQKEFGVIWPEVDAVAQMLGGYPGFWTAWTERMSNNPQSRDAALALNFLSASLKGQPISWSDVIERGLGQLLSATPGLNTAQENAQKNTQTSTPPNAAPAQVSFNYAEMAELAGAVSGSQADKAGPAKGPLGTEVATQESDSDSDLGADDEEEQFSLKTRSMAEVLAEQGDYVGALDIYEELLKAAKTPEEKSSLEEAIGRLSADVSVSSTEGSKTEDGFSPDKNSKGQGKGRLLDVLELLADRLESKAE